VETSEVQQTQSTGRVDTPIIADQGTNLDLIMSEALRRHWPEYLMEAAGLGLFMISACFFSTLLWHPASPVVQAIPTPLLRHVLTGIAMGLTAIGIIYSPWGKQSGAHLNPSITLTYLRLGKVARWDAVFYILSQFVGGVTGVGTAALLLGNRIADPAVNYAVTMPGMWGAGAAFTAEMVISFLMMAMVLNVSNRMRIARWTGVCAGVLVATYIAIEGPVSGMSMNPARTFGSALPADVWTALWIYFTAPPFGMLLAAQLYLRQKGSRGVLCAKFHHQNEKRCIFHCNYRAASDCSEAHTSAIDVNC
jgi:aquaporin Z